MIRVFSFIPLGTGALAAIFLAFFLGSTQASFTQARLLSTAAQAAGGQELPKVEPWEIDESLTRLSPIRFLPDHPLYFLITIKEKFDHFRKPNQAKKALFDVHLSGKKIKEAYLLSNKNDLEKASQSLQDYKKVQKRLQNELEQAANQGLPIFETQQLLADNLERHLKIIVILAGKSNNVNFKQELVKSAESASQTARLLEKSLPDAAKRILNFAAGIKIT